MRLQWACCCVRPTGGENTNTHNAFTCAAQSARSLDPADCAAPENFNSFESKFDLTRDLFFSFLCGGRQFSIPRSPPSSSMCRCTLILCMMVIVGARTRGVWCISHGTQLFRPN